MTAPYADRSTATSLNGSSSGLWRSPPPVENMGIDHRNFDIAMARQFLNRSSIIAAFEHVWRKGMLKNMSVALSAFAGNGALRHAIS
jgi:hypothetical protein